MTFADHMLSRSRPDSIRQDVSLPRRQHYHPSPADWRDEILYFLLVDRFSDGQENSRPLLNRAELNTARPALPNGDPWRWDRWAESGARRWQGGTIQGVISKLDYLQQLGVTTLWLSPVFQQRGHLDTYHGYGIQDFLDVDPRFGDRRDLVDLVTAAHAQGMRIILDIIFNHSGANWVYPANTHTLPYLPAPNQYPFGAWLGDEGQTIETIQARSDGVWPTELQNPDWYTRAGSGSLDDPNAEHKRSDFFDLRDFYVTNPSVLSDLAQCYKYWIALTDCDGFRMDTLKHVSLEEARNFCGSIKEFAANLGKHDFFLVGEVAGGSLAQDRYLDVLDRNLNAALDIGEMRPVLHGVAKGQLPPAVYFAGFDPGDSHMGSHRNWGARHVSILDDHDHVFGEKLRFSSDAVSDHQVVAGVAVQLFTLGIPCIYYGTEQALAGPEVSERQWLPGWGGGESADRYLREAMFGPLHPRQAGTSGMEPPPQGLDQTLPGFGPFGTAGQHCFDVDHPAYIRIVALTALRQAYPVLRYGRQYLRPLGQSAQPFALPGPGELVAWSRILDDEETLCVVNMHATEARGANILIDPGLNPPDSRLTVILNTAQTPDPHGYSGTQPLGAVLPVHRTTDGTAYVELDQLAPTEVLVLTNRPTPEEGGLVLSPA